MTKRTELEQLQRDVAGELDAVLKADSPDELRSISMPLLEICADSVAPTAESIDDGLRELFTAAIEALGRSPDSRALTKLFLGVDRWQPLGKRGSEAAAELGITYDALRRRNKDGQRKLDSLVEALANVVITHCSLGELLSELLRREVTHDPGKNAVERASVFLSYARVDDEHEGGIFSALRDSLIAEFRFQTGRELFVFHDKSNIDLGENWRKKLESGLDSTTFLLVLLTPSYLRSETCQEELSRFLERERSLGRDDLVLPVYYSTLNTEDLDDPLARTLLERQYVDWRDLRFQAFDSVDVRMAIAKLATALAAALARTSNDPTPPIELVVAQEEGGFVELVSRMELAMPRFLRSLVTIAAEQEGITEEVQGAAVETERLNQRGRGTSARLIVAQRLSKRLEPYTERMEECARDMRGDLDEIEGGLTAMASELPTSTEEGVDEVIQSMLQSLREAYAASEQTSTAIDEMSSTYRETARLVSTLKPILLRIVAAVAPVAETPKRMASWIATLEDAIERRKSLVEGAP